MGRTRVVQKLGVYLRKRKIGTLTRKSDGALDFRYEDSWIEKGYAVSLSMPLPDRTFTGPRTSFFFDNLLPDSEGTLKAIARKFGSPSTKAFDLLSLIGRECTGALSFFEDGDAPPSAEKMSSRSLDEATIAERLRGLNGETPLGMADGDFRSSLSGAQEKMALLHWKEHWFEPKGATPTSHILKRPVGRLMESTSMPVIDFERSVDNEWLCLFLADICGLQPAEATIETFEDQRVLSVRRFDREWDEKILTRIPQEDFCQATGTSPLLKYERKGGPSLRDLMRILARSNNADADRRRLFKTALFNDLIHNTDSHAKNFSLFHVRTGFALTPMYDLLSAHFLRKSHPEFYSKLRTSLRVNGKDRFRDIHFKDWRAEAKACGLTTDVLEEIVHELSQVVPHLDVPRHARPKGLDGHQLESILEGIRARAAQLWD